jgi:biopolymer transport protein ExbD
MKKYLPNFFVGSFGLCVGFVTCYLSLVPKAESKTTEISISRDGSMYLAHERIDPTRLSALLHEKSTSRITAVINADEHTDITKIYGVLTACQSAGIDRIKLKTAH